MLIVVFYLLIDREKFTSYIYNLSPLPFEHHKEIFEKFKDMAGAVLIGNGLAGLIQGILGGIVFFYIWFKFCIFVGGYYGIFGFSSNCRHWFSSCSQWNFLNP